MAGFFANLEPCLIGLKACGNSYHWARKLGEFGHSVKLMSPQLVKPYVKTNKHDRADAEAICEAVTFPTLLYIPIKTVEQQAMLSAHRARQTEPHRKIRYAFYSLSLSIVIPQGIQSIGKRLPYILEDAENGLPVTMRRLLERLIDHLKERDRQVKGLNYKSSFGTRRTKPAKDWKPFQVLVLSQRVPLWRQ